MAGRPTKEQVHRMAFEFNARHNGRANAISSLSQHSDWERRGWIGGPIGVGGATAAGEVPRLFAGPNGQRNAARDRVRAWRAEVGQTRAANRG